MDRTHSMAPHPIVLVALVALALTGCNELLGFGAFTVSDAAVGTPDGGSGTDAGAGVDGGADAGGGQDAGPPELLAPEPYFPWNGYASGSAQSGAAADAPHNALRPTFRWLPSAGATRYELQLSSTCSVIDWPSCDIGAASPVELSTTETSVRVSANLTVRDTAPVGSRYYWRVRACDATRCSEWAPTRYLDVGRILADIIDGDGTGDVVVTDPGASPGGVNRAGIALGYQRSTSLLPHEDMFAEEFGFFGNPVAFVGDVNGDGFGEVAVGRAQYVLVFFGGSVPLGPLLVQAPVGETERRIAAVAGGDLDGDGFSDVAIGNPGQASGAGKVHVYFGSSSGLSADPVTLESPLPTLPRGGFGAQLDAGADLDGDGRVDLAVVAEAENAGTVSEGGRIYFFTAWETRTSPPSPASWEPPSPVIESGFDLRVRLGDVTGDGYGDVIAASRTGTHILAGGPGGATPFTVLAVNQASALSAGYDVTGDGVGDLLLGVIGVDGATLYPGSSTLAEADARAIGAPSGALGFGQAVSLAGDLNGDGIYDAVIAAPAATPNPGIFVVTDADTTTPTATLEVDSTTYPTFGSFMAP